MGATPLPHPWVPGTEESPFEQRVQENFDKLATVQGSFASITAPGTVFPTTPFEGQRFTYIADATNGVLWEFVYHATGSAYDWWFVGGPPLYAEVTTEETTTSSTYAALATAGPVVTLPLAGDFMVSLGCRSYASANSREVWMSYDIGATGAVDADAVRNYGAASVDGVPATVALTLAKTRRKTGLTAVALTAKYKITGGNTATLRDRWITATPVRVG